MKSASYLLHMPEFTDIRGQILEHARAVLQDDSGAPLRFFEEDRWQLRFFGVCEQTLPPYRQWFQDDLREIYASRSDIEPLGFAIGYHSQIGGSCLIWAERKQNAVRRDGARSNAAKGASRDDWPQFRGPTGDGHAPGAEPPVTWSEEENVAWKTAIPGRGWSSPATDGKRIWLTTALDDERSLRAVAVDAGSGEIVHDVEVFRPADWRPSHAENSYASPTPVLAEDRVWVHFGSYGTACLSAADGSVLWRSQALDLDHEHGPGSSPVLFEDFLIVNCDGSDERFVAALDRDTGELAWKVPRSVELEHHKYAFSTPLLVEHEGAAQLVSSGAGQASAYDPKTGEEIWRVRFEGHSGVPRPVAGFGRVFVNTGYMKPICWPSTRGGSTATSPTATSPGAITAVAALDRRSSVLRQ